MTKLDRMLTPDEIAESIGQSREHVLRLIRRRELPAINAGGEGKQARYRVEPADFDRWKKFRAVA